jgi:hypothetical protein
MRNLTDVVDDAIAKLKRHTHYTDKELIRRYPELYRFRFAAQLHDLKEGARRKRDEILEK